MNAPLKLTALATLVALAAACAAPRAASRGASPIEPSRAEVAEQQHEGGAVTVVASWISGTASARVALDTHSVDLDGSDLIELARVRLDGGAWVRPTAWDAPKGGHHRSGTLTFRSLQPQALAAAQVIELEIRDVGTPSHLLRWERAR